MAPELSHPIASAAAEGDFDKVSSYIKARPDHREFLQDLALQYAAETGHEKLVKILLKQGAKIDPKIDHIRTALHAGHSSPPWCPPTAVHLAVRKGHQETVKILLKHERGNPFRRRSLKEDRWMSAFHEAVAKNDIAMAKLMLKYGVNVHSPDTCAECLTKRYRAPAEPLMKCGRCEGRTALHIAAELGYEDMVRMLIQHGATLKSQAPIGTTPLNLAAQRGHDGVVLALLQNGWKHGKVISGSSPVLLAAQNGHKAAVDVLFKHGGVAFQRIEWDIDPLIKTGDAVALELLLPHANNIIFKHDLERMLENAATGGDMQTFLVLLKYAVAQKRLDWVDYYRTFYFAAEDCESVVVKELINYCPWTQEEQDKNIPVLLFQAGCGGRLDVIQTLLEWGRPQYVMNALFGAIKSGHLSIIETLFEKGIDLQQGLPSTDGLSIDGCAHLALHTSAHYGHHEICQLLLGQGDSVDEYDRFGKTALHYAALRGTLQTIDLLLDRGARVDAPDQKGQTALHCAARMRSGGSGIKLLLRRGAFINAKDAHARSPLHIAAIEGNDDIYKLLLHLGADANATDNSGRTANQYLAEVQARRLEIN